MAGEIFLEIYPVEKALRITAVDPVTGTEVVFAAPKNTMRSRIEEIASQKLRARIARERARMPAQGEPAATTRRGKLV